ncbi:disulfide isomerase-like 5-4 [Seminavis robusta]|uniref:Disulfide isomerase-like 5-4 n=1 Tax=Seminavis robusta TaxID=568900 RepID=A0A9N8DQ03_9STRA|nr:disulfide isomerase-like 5-4 [Seminavis robusta]|eukprot:Sro270_g104190.1 disulfide isomerase-like 5-4 (694) ;mRNA; f:19148-21353
MSGSSGSGSGSGPGPRRWMSNLDMYKKVPSDLMEGTAQGSFFSYLILFVIFSLVYLETKSFMSYQVVEELALDTQHLHRKKSIFGGNKFQSIDTLNSQKTQKIQVRFNITMMDLKCEFATIDVVSVLGAQQNVTKNLQKWMVSPEGVQERYDKNRNLQQHDLEQGTLELHDKTVTKSIQELHKNGEDAVNLDEQALQTALKEYPFVFVDFFANWCSHCKIFAPTWERLAELMIDAKTHHHERVVAEMEQKQMEEKRLQLAKQAAATGETINLVQNLTYSEEEYQQALQAVRSPLLVGKIDCVTKHQLCRKQGIMSYPTIRLFVNGELFQDFFGSRTVANLLQFLVLAEEKVLGKQPDNENDRQLTLSDHAAVALDAHNVTDEQKAAAIAAERQRSQIWKPSEHPGCQIAGTLFLNKVPGNFYIQAQSPTHSLEPTLTNVSHEVHHLYFVTQRPPGVKPPKSPEKDLDESQRAQDGTIMVPPPSDSSVSGLSHPMNGNVYVTHGYHQAHHHYIKLVATNLYTYQVVQNSQMVHYNIDQVPEAKFVLDLSPIAVTYHATKRHWYDYITSIMAIVGGTFTVVGIVDGLLRTAVKTTQKVVLRRRRNGTKARQQQNRSLPRPPPQPTREAFQHSSIAAADPASRPIAVQRPNAAVSAAPAALASPDGVSTRPNSNNNSTTTATSRKSRTALPRPPGR